MNILGNIVFKNPDVLQQKIKNDKDEEHYELYILAQETAVQGAEVALEATKKETTTEKPKEVPNTGFGKRKGVLLRL